LLIQLLLHPQLPRVVIVMRRYGSRRSAPAARRS